jgi:hypothetical protein
MATTLGSGLKHRPDAIDLALAFAEGDQGDALLFGKGFDRSPEGVSDGSKQRRRRDRVTPVRRQEGHHLPTDLQVGNIGVEVDPVEALDLQAHVSVQQLVDVDDFTHAAPPSPVDLRRPCSYINAWPSRLGGLRRSLVRSRWRACRKR